MSAIRACQRSGVTTQLQPGIAAKLSYISYARQSNSMNPESISIGKGRANSAVIESYNTKQGSGIESTRAAQSSRPNREIGDGTFDDAPEAWA
jgi:hypothetical protein